MIQGEIELQTDRSNKMDMNMDVLLRQQMSLENSFKDSKTFFENSVKQS